MNERTIKMAIFSAVIALGSMTSCTKNDGPGGNSENGSGPDNSPRQFITLTATFPDAENTAGNGGTLAYSISQEDAGNPNKEINVFADGYALRSQRTARVQGSINGNFLYNIQYTGANGGVFNKYKVSGGKQFDDTNEELNVSSTLGTSPRWVKAAEGVGIGVNISGASAPVDVAKAEAGTPQTYTYTRGTASVAIINLDDPSVPNTTEFAFPLTDAEKEAGYSVTRLDVPIINGGKVFIGCAVSKVDPTKAPVKTTNRAGEVTWGWASDAPNIKGTATLVLDYPSLANPKLIWSTQSKYGNNSYRTMTQYVGTDGNVYQSTGVNTTSYPHILRINRSTGDYDNTYLFDLSKALGTSNLTGIKAWRYIQDGIGIVLYTEANVAGGYIALVDLNAKTATKLATEIQSDAGFSGATGLTGTLTQFQNIGLAGDFAYVPMTPNGKDGNLYIVNWKTKTIAKGIKLKGQAGSFFLGAY